MSGAPLTQIVVLAVFAVVDALHRERVRGARGEEQGAGLGAGHVAALVGYPLALLGLLEHAAVWTPLACLGIHLVDLGVARGARRPWRAVLRVAGVAGALLAVAAYGSSMADGSSSRHLGTAARFAAVPALAGYTAAFALVIGAGQDLVRAVLESTHALPAEPAEREALLGADPPMGRAIGVLERLVLVTFVLAGAWSGIGMILAAKSIARFRELEQRAFAEYYLVGTLASVLVALAVGGVVRALLGGGAAGGGFP